MQQRSRESSYELMRIISMILIVIFHILRHGSVFVNTSGASLIIFRFLEALTLIHVNSFVLLSGYFQCEKEFKMSKLLKLNNQAWFYRVVIAVVLLFFNFVSMTNVEIFNEFFPIPIVNYWFINVFILLYCVSPFLNKFIKNLSKKDYHKLLFVLFIIISILPSLTGQRSFNNNRGFSLVNFIFLYFIGAYLKQYPLNKNYLFNRFSMEGKRLIYFFMFFLLAMFNFLLFYFTKELLQCNNEFTNYLASIIIIAFEAYDSPLIILQSIFYFSIFSTFSFKNKFINKLSGLMFGIYLIHDNDWIRKNIYIWLGLENYKAPFVNTFLKVCVCAIIIFVGCAIIEFLRQKLFQFIYNRKISTKWREKYRGFINRIGFNINW